MNYYRVYFRRIVLKPFYVDVKATNQKEAEKMVDSGRAITGWNRDRDADEQVLTQVSCSEKLEGIDVSGVQEA